MSSYLFWLTVLLGLPLQIDKEGANVEKVKQELSEAGLLPEEWGGDTSMVPVCSLQISAGNVAV